MSVFDAIPVTNFTASRSLIPREAGHRFRQLPRNRTAQSRTLSNLTLAATNARCALPQAHLEILGSVDFTPSPASRKRPTGGLRRGQVRQPCHFRLTERTPQTQMLEALSDAREPGDEPMYDRLEARRSMLPALHFHASTDLPAPDRLVTFLMITARIVSDKCEYDLRRSGTRRQLDRASDPVAVFRSDDTKFLADAHILRGTVPELHRGARRTRPRTTLSWKR